MKKQIVDLHFEDEASYDHEEWANFDDEVGDVHGIDVNANILLLTLCNLPQLWLLDLTFKPIV